MVGASRELYPRNKLQTGSTILVVEDEVLVRMMIADELRNAGYTVLEASNADEALKFCVIPQRWGSYLLTSECPDRWTERNSRVLSDPHIPCLRSC